MQAVVADTDPVSVKVKSKKTDEEVHANRPTFLPSRRDSSSCLNEAWMNVLQVTTPRLLHET